MKSALKWGAIVVVGLVVVIIAALLIIPAFVDVQKYKPMLESKVTDATGRPFSVGDDLSLSLFPWAGLSFSNLEMGNTKGFTEKEFVNVESFEVRLKLLPLIFKEIEIKRFVVNEPRIMLIKNKDGRVNWAQPQTKSDQPAESKPEPKTGDDPGLGLPINALMVGNFSINNGSVIYIDHSSGAHKEVTNLNVVLQDVSLERPIQMTVSALLDKKPLSIEGTVGPVGKNIGEGAIPLDIAVKALKEINLKMKGKVENPMANPQVSLALEISEFSPRKVMAALDLEFPVDTADPDALTRVAFTADIVASAAKVRISNGVLDLDESKLNLSMQAAEFDKPNLAFDFDLDQIDLDRYLPPKSDKPTAGTAPKTAKSPAKKKTDYTPLRKLVMDGSIKIGKLTASKAHMQNILLKIRAKNGIITLDPMKLDMYQGSVAGRTQLNVTQDSPKTSVKVNVQNVQVNPLLKDVLEKDILEGATNASIALSMAGEDPDTIKKTLNGEGKLLFNDGALVGFDLARMARNVTSAFSGGGQSGERPRTDFTELSVPFTLKNGLFNTPQSSMKSPFVRLIASGDADLVKETINMRVEPKAVASIKGQGDEDARKGLMVPIVITGSFSSPKFRPDLVAAAKQEAVQKLLGSDEDATGETDQSTEGKAKGLIKGLLQKD